MAPGLNDRQTGTVPKVKSHNYCSPREYAHSVRRERNRANIPNNLITSQTDNALADYPNGCVPFMAGGSRRTESVSSGRSNSEESCGTALRTSDTAKGNELKMKVEESQRRLQALQDHQAALTTLQQKAQVQLKEAKAAHGILVARTVGIQCNGAPAREEQSAVCMNNNTVQGGRGLQGNMQHMADRLHSLQELYDNRHQLVEMLGERDEELVSEHMVLQDKLRELQHKKQQMDHLVAEFQTLNSLPGLPPVSDTQMDRGSSMCRSEDGEVELSESDADCEIVKDKIAELNKMKSQLAQLKSLMSEVHNNTAPQNDACENSNDAEDFDHEDQAVNLRRLKRDKSKGRNVTGSNSRPDSTVPSLESDRARDIHFKTIQLQEAKARLQQLQDLLSAVSDVHNRGQSLPDQYLELLSQEASREEGLCKVNRSSAERERTPQYQDNCEERPQNAEVTLEMVQAMTQDLRQQTLNLQEERERLMSARRELAKVQRELPHQEKKTNTQVDTQMLLQAELQAKRRELEELMRKDQGQTSTINQDVCSNISADKSDTTGYSFIAEGSTHATWGGSAQGTLDDLAEQNNAQDHSVGYSSDEGHDEDGVEATRVPSVSSQQMRLSQLNNNSNVRDPPTRDLLSMSLDSTCISPSGNINTNHSNTASRAGSVSQAPAPTSAASSNNRTRHANVWRKGSTDSAASVPRGVWTPSSQQTRQVEELVSSSNLDTSNRGSSSSGTANGNWWQQQALILQHQLEMTSNLCQNMLREQTQHGNNLLPYWNFSPPAPTGGAGPLLPSYDLYYQQLLATSQFQQQQMMLTTVNQCCHMLWLQQRELMALRTVVNSLQEKSLCANNNRRGEGYSPSIVVGHPDDTSQNSAHQSQSNLTRLQQAQSHFSPHQNLKISYSGGLFQSPEELASTSGVTSAHSLPNLSQTTTSTNSVFPPYPTDTISSNAPLNNIVPSVSAADQFPMNNSVNLSNRSSLVHPSSWLPQSHSAPSPVPALNNQVPPGNRANNYWDNFRSYSRQNLLSASTKSNEGMSHSPSPLVDRSHNTLRTHSSSFVAAGIPPATSAHSHSIATAGCGPDENTTICNMPRKEKLNTEQYQAGQDSMVLPRVSHSNMTGTSGLNYQLTDSANPQLRLRNPHYASDFTSRSASQDLQCLGVCSGVAEQAQNTSEFHLEQNLTNRSLDLPEQSFFLCQNNQELELSVVSNPVGVNKRKSCKLSSHHNSEDTREVSTGAGDHKHQTNRGIFDALSESVYSEVAALISANENRPHFLIQLFRDLQMVSSDSLRQKILRSIHEVLNQRTSSGTASQVQNEMIEIQNNLNTSQSGCSSDDETAKEGAVASSAVPSNADWRHKEGASHSAQLSGRGSKLDWEVQTVLADLLPFLRAHLDDTCSTSLLETIRRFTLQLVPPQNMSQSGCFYQGQLDALLEDALLKFQGCRLSDISEELLTVVAEVLLSELTFLRLVDTVSRGHSEAESSEDCNKNAGIQEHGLEQDSQSNLNSQQPNEPSLLSESGAQAATVNAEAYNGDLAEADQSHHEESTAGLLPEVEAEHGAEEAFDGQVTVENDLLLMTDPMEAVCEAHAEMLSAQDNDELAQLAVNIGDLNTCEINGEEEWEVEQDRELGLDHVPIRLSTEQQRPTDNTPPERETHPVEPPEIPAP